MKSAAQFSRRLSPFTGFGSNPGQLKAYTYFPATALDQSALVVVLHGCTQTAEGYDRGSGWSKLADQQGFALLYPEQQKINNPNLCFNWFEPGDTRRGAGEAQSIHEMVAALVATRGIDPLRVFITGLSAGGAMTSVMLACYPEVFAGGAIIGGLPYGAANTVAEAFERMRGHNSPNKAQLQSRLRAASTHQGQWPTLSLWHGTHDQTVRPRNMDQIIEQWSKVHGVAEQPSSASTSGGFRRQAWSGADGREAIVSHLIPGMAHGVPLATRGADGLGVSAPFMLDVGISSTLEIARFWNLAPQATASTEEPHRFHEADARDGAVLDGEILAPSRVSAQPKHQDGPRTHPINAIENVINKALRAAGLLR
jgi:poly(hydroxyalkanoate) depolymerase family esterase